jgi:hypothetical protein
MKDLVLTYFAVTLTCHQHALGSAERVTSIISNSIHTGSVLFTTSAQIASIQSMIKLVKFAQPITATTINNKRHNLDPVHCLHYFGELHPKAGRICAPSFH